MCGIIFKSSLRKNVNEDIIEQYQNQINRGQSGFGIAYINKKNKIEVKRAVNETKFMIDLYLNPSKTILAHHRIPTSTKNTIKSAHPILVDNKSLKYKYLIIHNGMINNCDKIREKHEKMGFNYTTLEDVSEYYEAYNDSETVAIETALFIEKKIKEIETTGSMAIIGIKIDKKTNKAINYFAFRNTLNPINIKQTKTEIMLSSEGEGKELEHGTLHTINPKTLKITKKKIKLNEYYQKEIGFNTGTKKYTNCKTTTITNYKSKEPKYHYSNTEPKISIAKTRKQLLQDFEDRINEFEAEMMVYGSEASLNAFNADTSKLIRNYKKRYLNSPEMREILEEQEEIDQELEEMYSGDCNLMGR